MPDPSEPIVPRLVPAHCGCGARFLAHTVLPRREGELLDRKCDSCLAAAARVRPPRPVRQDELNFAGPRLVGGL